MGTISTSIRKSLAAGLTAADGILALIAGLDDCGLLPDDAESEVRVALWEGTDIDGWHAADALTVGLAAGFRREMGRGPGHRAGLRFREVLEADPCNDCRCTKLCRAQRRGEMTAREVLEERAAWAAIER